MSFTIVIKFSRRWCLIPFFKRFDQLTFDRSNCNLIFINNTADEVLSGGALSHLATSLPQFKSFQLIQTNSPHFERYDHKNFHNVPAPFSSWTAYYSFQMHKIIADVIKDDIHIQLEDDTLPPPATITSLLNLIEVYPGAAMSAVACPQRESGMKIVGHNSYEEVILKDGFLVRRKNTPVYREGIKEIVATGYHAVGFKRDPFLAAIKYIEGLPFRIVGSGSDVYFTNHIFSKYGKILCDFSLWCDHLHMWKKEIITYKVDNCKPWLHVWNPKTNKYNYDFIEDEARKN